MHDVRDMGRKDFNSPGGLPLFRRGMMIAFFQIWGHSARWNELLKMSNSVCRALSPRAFRKEGGMSSGPAAPFARSFAMARFNSRIENLGGGGESAGALSRYFSSRFVSRSSFEKCSLLTDA